MVNWSKMSPDSCRHQVNTPGFQSERPRPYVFLQHRMRWTRLRSACWCMLIYSVTKKNPPPKVIEFLLWYPPSWGRGALDIATLFNIHQHHPKITIAFPVNLGQSPHVRPFSVLPHAKLGLGPRDKRVNEVALGCSSASYQEVVLSVFTSVWEGIRVGREQPWIGLFRLAEIGFYFQTKWLL